MPKQAPVPLQPSHRKKKKKRLPKAIRILLVMLPCLLILCVCGLVVYAFWLNGQLKRNAIPQDNSALGIDSQFNDEKYDDITNIALFGVDTRQGESCRSDAIMILTVDRKNNKMKATSLLRDSYVTIQGRKSKEKLAHAYAYGGPELAIQTINQNFGLNVRDYVTVDFDSMAKVVDAMGGVTIDVQANEIKSTNESIKEYCKYYKETPTYVKKAGVQTLNGMQACGYSRVRYAGNGDDRQRTDRAAPRHRAGFQQGPSHESAGIPLHGRQGGAADGNQSVHLENPGTRHRRSQKRQRQVRSDAFPHEHGFDAGNHQRCVGYHL